MSNIIDSIKLSGTVYTIQGSGGGGGNPTVELTQAEYDALVSAGTVSADTYYIITDAQAGDLTQYWTSAQTQSAINQATSGKADTTAVTQSITEATSGKADTTAVTQSITEAVSGKQDTLISGTNIKTINNESLLGSGNITIQGGGGGTSYSAGRGIDITNDTISFSLPISAGTRSNSIIENDSSNVVTGEYGHAEGFVTKAGYFAHSEGRETSAISDASHAEGMYTLARGVSSHAEGHTAKAFGDYSHAEGIVTISNNYAEHASGSFNVSSSASTTFGDSGNTLFSVGNGTADNARHNAFEIRQNGDIYISSGGTDIKLQDNLGGGGGGSITIDPSLDSGSTNPVANSAITTAINAKADTTAVTQSITEAVSGKADTSAVTAVQDSLSGYVTTDTAQNIRGIKTFIGDSDANHKPIIFKQANSSHKIGFSCQNSASTNNELATFEFRPNTYTDGGGVKHPLLYIGHYRTNLIANAGVVQTMVGFRQYDQKGAAAYHYLMPLPAEAKTPFSLTTSYKNYFAPLGFKNGSTMITTDNTGVADFSDVLGGLKLVKLTQSAYDALSPNYDSNTLYIIKD